MSNQPLGNYFRKAYQDFHEGLNTVDDPIKTTALQLKQLDNAFVNNIGMLEKAPGYILDSSPFSSSAANSLIRMLVNYKRGSTVDKLICAAQDDTNANADYKVDIKQSSGDGNWDYVAYTTGTALFTNASTAVVGTGTAWLGQLKAGDKIKAGTHADSVYAEIASITNDTNLVLSAVYTGATTLTVAYKARIILHKDFLPRAITYNNKLVITNGSQSLMTFDNTTLLVCEDGQCPAGKLIEAHKRRVFVAGTSSLPSSIFWSAVNDETNWDSGSTEPIAADDNGSIVNIKSFADSLIVFKDSGNIYQVVGNFDQDATGSVDYVRKVDLPENIGLIIGLTATVGNDNKLYFLTETGIYSIDRSLRVQHESWDIRDTFPSLQLKSTLTSSKIYTYNSQTEWDTGTKSGTRSTTGGNIESIFDDYSISDAYKHLRACSVKIDSSNVVHVIYIQDSNRKVIKYAKFALDGTLTTETVYTDASEDVLTLDMDVASNGNIAVAFQQHETGTGLFDIFFTERNSGSGNWSTVTNSVGDYVFAYAVKYDSTSTAHVASLFREGAGTALVYSTPTGTSFNNVGGRSAVTGHQDVSSMAMAFTASDDPFVAFYDNFSDIVATLASADAGVTFPTSVNVSATALGATANVCLGLNNLAQKIVVYGDNGSVKKYNLTTSTASTLSSATDKVSWYSIVSDKQAWSQISSAGTETLFYETSYSTGTASFTNGSTAITGSSTEWSKYLSVGDTIKASAHADSVYGTILTINSDTSITLTAVYAGSTAATAAYISKHQVSVVNPSTATCDTTIRPSSNCGSGNTTPVYAFGQFGANAAEIVIRRIAPKAVWTSNERSDATLTAWGTYVVDDQVSNSNTVQHDVALNTVSPVATFVTIIDGSVISTDASKIFIKARMTVLLTAWSKSVVGAINMAYTGTGIDGKLPTGITFDNELYFSVCGLGQTSNDKVLVYDRKGAWVGPVSYPVTVFCRYKNQLYAGSSSNGKVFKLLNSFGSAGSAYTMTAVTKEDILGSIELEKDVYKAYVLFKIQDAGTFTFSHRLNNFMYPAGATWKDTSVDQTALGIAEISVGDKCRSIQFKVSNSSLDNQVSIIGIVVLYGFLNVR